MPAPVALSPLERAAVELNRVIDAMPIELVEKINRTHKAWMYQLTAAAQAFTTELQKAGH